MEERVESFVSLSHPNVCPIWGFFRSIHHPNQIGLVSPWYESGNLLSYLLTHTQEDRIKMVYNLFDDA